MKLKFQYQEVLLGTETIVPVTKERDLFRPKPTQSHLAQVVLCSFSTSLSLLPKKVHSGCEELVKLLTTASSARCIISPLHPNSLAFSRALISDE